MSEAIASKEERLAAYNANVAAAEKDPRLSPETGKPLDKVTMFRFGAVLGGVMLFLTGTTHNAVLLTIFYCGCMFGLNCMIAPLVAILSDRVPSGIRGTMSAFYGAGSTIGAPIGTMLGALFIENLVPGFAVPGVLMFLGGVVAVIILPKEQSADFLPKDEGSFKDILVSFRPPKFSTAHDFYKAFAGRFCMLISYQMINVYQLYIIQNYIGQSVKESAVTVSVVSMIMMVMSLVGSFISGPVSDFIGRRKVPVIMSTIVVALGYNFAFPVAIALAIIGCIFIMAIKKVK